MNELYYEAATHAVKMEKQHSYGDAEYAWKLAAEYAKNPKNKEYALGRSVLNNKRDSINERYLMWKLERRRLHADQKERKAIAEALQAHLNEEKAL
ncbi:ANR family transcriptional regulator [Sodalis sp.]|uniref:ANR family transcriptional regulator n=1 Tax=Sodalis sp. (in: enterobacteria) TaxID=1898979 RepID=UPI003873432D